MVKCIVNLFIVLFIAALFGCSTANNKPVLIDFSSDRKCIVISGVNPAGLLQLKNKTAGDSTVYGLVSVLQTPSERDTSIRESPIMGKILVTDSNIVFKPDLPFVKGNDYLVVTYLNAQFGGAGQMLKGELSSKLKPVQKVLTR